MLNYKAEPKLAPGKTAPLDRFSVPPLPGRHSPKLMMTNSVPATTLPPASATTGPASTGPLSAQTHPELEAYWVERKRYLQKIRNIPELRGRYLKAGLVYLLRRLLWSFGFFPLFLGFWIPLVIARFNPVAMVQDLLPSLQAFVSASPQVQASTLETVAIAWLSIGFIFAVFDFVLTPFKSPYEYEAEVHMRAWEQVQMGERATHAAETAADDSGQ